MKESEQLDNLKNLNSALIQIKNAYQEAIELNNKLKENTSGLLEQQKSIKSSQKEIQNETKETYQQIDLIQELIDNVSSQSKKVSSLLNKEFSNLLKGDLKNFKTKLTSIIKNTTDHSRNNLIRNMIIGDFEKKKFGLLSGAIRDSMSEDNRQKFGNAIFGEGIKKLFTSMLKPQARAIGGTVDRNHPYIVGEYGPELFIPEQHGRIANNHSKANNVSINLTINTPNIDSFRKSQQQIINEISNNLKF